MRYLLSSLSNAHQYHLPVLLLASYFYVPIIPWHYLFRSQDFKMSMQYVSEKVVGRYIRRLRDITCVCTISIIILASYLYVLIVLLGSLTKILRCLVELIRTVHIDY